MKLSDILVKEALIPELAASERDAAIEELADALVAAGAVPGGIRDELVAQILEREKRGSTGFGKGVAVPHVKHPEIESIAVAIGVSAKGVDFNALDKAPVYSIVLVLSPEDKPDEHLQAMESIFSRLQQDTFRRFLRQSTSREEIFELIEETDAPPART